MSNNQERGWGMMPEVQDQVVRALKFAYRKYSLGDEKIAFKELDDVMFDALCEAVGDIEFVRWTNEVRSRVKITALLDALNEAKKLLSHNRNRYVKESDRINLNNLINEALNELNLRAVRSVNE